MIGWLRTLVFFAGWTGFTAAFGVAALPLLVSQRSSWWAAQCWATITLAWLRLSCGIASEVRGLPASRLIASKHQSAWDTLMLWRTLKNPAFVLKRELYWVPIFGWYLWRTGQIAINRRDGRTAMQTMLEKAAQALKKGRSVVIFPEGTRVPPGEFLPFRAGIARLSLALHEPVTPVALNAGHFWPKHTVKKSPGRAVLEFMPPVDYHEPMPAWLSALQDRINAQSAALAPRTVQLPVT